jgi:Flp pilus assembly protein TadB
LRLGTPAHLPHASLVVVTAKQFQAKALLRTSRPSCIAIRSEISGPAKTNYRKAAGRHKSDRNQSAVAAALIVVAVAVVAAVALVRVVVVAVPVVAVVAVVPVVVVASLVPKVEKCLGLAP